MTRSLAARIVTTLEASGAAKYTLELLLVGAVYCALARIDLTLDAIHPNPLPLAQAPGFALAAVLLRGLRIWPAILVAALAARVPAALADATLADWVVALSIAPGSTLEAITAGYLIRLWSDRRTIFQTPAAAIKFTMVSLGPSTMLAATIGVGAMCLAGAAGWADFVARWVTWWLRDASSLLVIAPAVVLWTNRDLRTTDSDKILFDKNLASATAFLATAVMGFMAFNPLFEPPVPKSVLVVLALLPLLWAALRCNQRDTVTCTLILSCFVIWGAWFAVDPSVTGGEDPFLASAIFLISASALGLVVSADIAQRHRVKAKLALQEQNLRALLGHADVGIAQIDTTGRFRLVNSRYCHIVRRSAAQLLQSRIGDLIHADDRPQMLTLLAHAIRTGESFVVETKTILPDGAWIRSTVAAILDQNGSVQYLAAVAEDVTARRRAEEKLLREQEDLLNTVRERTATLRAEIEQRERVEDALKHDIAERRKTHEALMESEWRFRTVIQGISDYAIFLLDRDGCIANWNVGAQRIHQYTAAEIVGRHFSRFYSEEEQQAREPARALQVAAYEGKYAVEGWRVRRDESRFWASVVIEAVRDDAGTLVGFVNITRDVTERQQAQASLERAQDQLAQSQKMEALGQLTGSIAHDFNNLLMIVSGHAQLLRRRLSDPKHLQATDAIHSAANRGESLTRQLLAFSRRQPLNPVVTDLKERVESVHDMLVGSLRGNVQLKCDIATDVWPVEIDIAELELGLVNIAVNARDAMPGGGVITLSARNIALRKSDGVDQLEGDFVALAMTDTGVGIAPDVLPRIFEPFFTTKAIGKGTGLGLAQVYAFSHQSGGTVVATSTVGSGSTITIYLPRKDAIVPKATDVPATEPTVPGHGTILLVEDNAEVAEVSGSLLEQLGYNVLRAANATDALNKLQRGHQVVLVFSDIVMPGSMNGIALAQEIGNRYPRIPVLLTSGYSDVVHTAASRFRILRKPFQLGALEKAIREALEHAQGPGTDDRVLQFPSRRQNHAGTIAI